MVRSVWGQLYHDNCFNFETDIINDEGERDKDTVRVDFSLDDNHGFARAYYRDELIKANCDPDFKSGGMRTTNEIQSITTKKISVILG